MSNAMGLVPRIDRIHLRGLLSFGPESEPFELRDLNVLIGPNASGKSNLIEAFSLLRSLPDAEIEEVLRKGGGSSAWMWKHSESSSPALEVGLSAPFGRIDHALRLLDMSLDEARTIVVIGDEQIVSDPWALAPPDPSTSPSSRKVFRTTSGWVVTFPPMGDSESDTTFRRKASSSILAQFAAFALELDSLARAYRGIRIYREWTFGPNSPLRNVVRTDLPDDVIAEDFSNVPLVLSRLGRTPKVKNQVLERMRDLYPRFSTYEVIHPPNSSWCELRVTEGDVSIPAHRLSDGTLRYLCLVALLTDPEPPPLICLEEPEIGLHPDVVVKLADMLVDASSRTRLIVTTHSDTLVDALTDHPESIVICENKGGSTTLERLDPERMAVWLEKYSLGTLWTDGMLGGNRW